MTRLAPSASSARVRPPGPGPISMTVAPSSGPAARAIRAVRLRSSRKVLAEGFACRQGMLADDVAQGRQIVDPAHVGFCRRHPRGEPQGCGETRRVGLAGAGNVEGGAVVRRGADERQSQRDVDGVLERNRLDRDQRLVVIHADGAVIGVARRGVEHGIRRQGSPGVDAFGAQRLNGRCDDVDVFAAERAVFAGMRVEARYRKPRPGKAEMRLQIRDRNPGGCHDQFARELGQRLAQRKMDGDGNDGERG